MTFYIPPVFLFGNNANRFHNNEEEKSEYKTAAETEIKVENWRAKRIAELEEENRKLREERDMLIEDLISDKELQQQIAQKQVDYYRENKKLKEELKWWKDLVHKAKEFEYDEDGMDYIWQNTKNL